MSIPSRQVGQSFQNGELFFTGRTLVQVEEVFASEQTIAPDSYGHIRNEPVTITSATKAPISQDHVRNGLASEVESTNAFYSRDRDRVGLASGLEVGRGTTTAAYITNAAPTLFFSTLASSGRSLARNAPILQAMSSIVTFGVLVNIGTVIGRGVTGFAFIGGPGGPTVTTTTPLLNGVDNSIKSPATTVSEFQSSTSSRVSDFIKSSAQAFTEATAGTTSKTLVRDAATSLSEATSGTTIRTRIYYAAAALLEVTVGPKIANRLVIGRNSETQATDGVSTKVFSGNNATSLTEATAGTVSKTLVRSAATALGQATQRSSNTTRVRLAIASLLEATIGTKYADHLEVGRNAEIQATDGVSTKTLIKQNTNALTETTTGTTSKSLIRDAVGSMRSATVSTTTATRLRNSTTSLIEATNGVGIRVLVRPGGETSLLMSAVGVRVRNFVQSGSAAEIQSTKGVSGKVLTESSGASASSKTNSTTFISHVRNSISAFQETASGVVANSFLRDGVSTLFQVASEYGYLSKVGAGIKSTFIEILKKPLYVDYSTSQTSRDNTNATFSTSSNSIIYQEDGLGFYQEGQ